VSSPWLPCGRRSAERAVRFVAALGSVALLVALGLGAAFVCSPSGAGLGRLPSAPVARSEPRGDGLHASVLFVGDVHFGESYFPLYGPIDFLAQHGYAYPWQQLRPLLDAADLVVANLETPLTGLRASPLEGRKDYLHWGDPVRTVEALGAAHVGVVSLGNNHAMDFLEPGLRDTLQALAAGGIAAVGAGPSLERAAEIYRHDLRVGRHVLRLGVLALLERTWEDFDLGAFAGGGLGGAYAPSAATVRAELRAVRQAEPRLWLVAFPHWGDNYAWRTHAQTALAHALLEAGASLVVGHGAHVLQEIEPVGDRWVLYGLGNFAFLSPGRFAQQGVHPYGMAARIELTDQADGVGMVAKLYFIHSDNRLTGFQPRLLDGAELDRAVELVLRGGTLDPESRQRLQAAATVERDEIGGHLRIDLGSHEAELVAPPARE
jgi:hypothetical protein